MRTIKAVGLFLFYALAGTGGLVFLKLALADKLAGIRSFNGLLQAVSDVRFILGFLLYCSSFLMWMYILSKFPLHYSYPIANSLVLVFVTVVSIIVLREQVHVTQLLGILLCLSGIIVIYLN